MLARSVLRQGSARLAAPNPIQQSLRAPAQNAAAEKDRDIANLSAIGPQPLHMRLSPTGQSFSELTRLTVVLDRKAVKNIRMPSERIGGQFRGTRERYSDRSSEACLFGLASPR